MSNIIQFIDGSTKPRTGVAEGLTLENGNKVIKVDLEVAKLSGNEDLVIGIDLFKPLGFVLMNIPFSWPSPRIENTTSKTSSTIMPLPKGIAEDRIAEEWRSVLDANQSLPINSICKLEGAELSIDTGDAKPVWIRQYSIPEAHKPRVSARIKEWADNGWIMRAPANCQWNLPLLAAMKPTKEIEAPDDIHGV